MAGETAQGITRGAAPYLLLAGLGVLVYLKRDQIAAWFKGHLPGAGLGEAVGNFWDRITFWDNNQLTEDEASRMWAEYQAASDRLAASDLAYQAAKKWDNDCLNSGGVITMDNGVKVCGPSGVWQRDSQGNPITSEQAAAVGCTGTICDLDVTYSDVPQVDNYLESQILSLMRNRNTTREIAEAYMANTYGLDWNSWQAKVFSSPEFASRVGLPELGYQAVYGSDGVYLGPNLNPLVPQNDPDYTTIYNPSTGAMWSGSSSSTSYLMGDSPEAAAWRARYL